MALEEISPLTSEETKKMHALGKLYYDKGLPILKAAQLFSLRLRSAGLDPETAKSYATAYVASGAVPPPLSNEAAHAEINLATQAIQALPPLNLDV